MAVYWHFIGSLVVVKGHWIGNRLVNRLSSAIEWHYIGSQVALDWQSSGIGVVRLLILVEWQSSDNTVASNCQINVFLIEESSLFQWHHGGVQVAMDWQ